MLNINATQQRAWANGPTDLGQPGLGHARAAHTHTHTCEYTDATEGQCPTTVAEQSRKNIYVYFTTFHFSVFMFFYYAL